MKVINPDSKLKHVFYPDSLNLNHGPSISYPVKYYTEESSKKALKEYLQEWEVSRDYIYIGTYLETRTITKEDIKTFKRKMKIDSLIN